MCNSTSDKTSRRFNMIRQPSSHFILCSQKIAFESSIQLVVPGRQASSNKWQIPHIHTRVEHFGETIIIFVLLESLLSSKVMRSLTMLHLLTTSCVQLIAECNTSNAPVTPVSAACSSAQPPESVSPSTTTDPYSCAATSEILQKNQGSR